MEVIRDSKWSELYSHERKRHPEEYAVKFANAVWRASRKMDLIKSERKKRSIKILTDPPGQLVSTTPVSSSSKIKKCQSMTLTGKPCQFKATSECGRFCKKHCI